MGHRKRYIPPGLHDLLRQQAGVISREQATVWLPARCLQRLVAEEQWFRIGHGLYSLRREPSWLGWAWAGLLIGGSRAVIGGAAALYLAGLLTEEPEPITIFSPAHRFRKLPRQLRLVQVARPGRGEPSCEPLDEAFIDAWSELSEGEFLVVLGQAIQQRRTAPKVLLDSLAERSRCPRRRRLSQVLSQAQAGLRSPLEVLYRDDVERAHGLPAARRQVRLPGGLADVLYEECLLVVELDGRTGHADGLFRDMRRDNRNAALGLLTLRFGWADVHGDPCGVAAQVAATLQVRGWRGEPVGCRRCRRAA